MGGGGVRRVRQLILNHLIIKCSRSLHSSRGCRGLREGGKAGEAVNTKPSYYLIQSIITLFSGV